MRTRLASAALLVIASFAILIPNHPTGRVPSEDAGAFFYIAERVLAGGVPYRDVWDHKPPAVYAVDALGLAAGGVVGVWIVQLGFLVAAALLSLVALRPFGERAALAGSLAWLLASPRLFLADGAQTSFVEFYGLPLQFGVLALAARECERGGASWRTVAIGALGAAAFLFKPTLVGLALAAAVLFLVSQRGSALRRIAAMLFGGVAVLAAAAVPFIASGAMGELIDQVVHYNSVYASFASPADRIDSIASGLRLTLPSGLCVVAIAAWAYALATRRVAQPIVALAVIALPIEMLLSSAGRGYHYYFLAWLPAMGVLVAFAAREVERRFTARSAIAFVVVALIAMSVRPAMLVARLAGEHDLGTARAAAAFLATATRPDEAVLIWGSHVEVLFLAERVAPTRYAYQYAALETRGYATPARVDELLEDLARRPPALIVDASRDSFVTPPLDREAFRRWTSPEPQYAALPQIERVIAFVAERYVPSGEIPGTGWVVWRLRS